MAQRLARCLVLLTLLAPAASCASVPTRIVVIPTATPFPTPVPTSTNTPTPTSTPTPTPTPTPAPTIEPDVVASIVDAGQTRLEVEGVTPLCLQWKDADDDGTAEWLGLYLHPGEPPALRAFVLDGETWYDLQPLEKEKHGLGEYPTCELEVRDANADGRTEILIWGHAGDSIDLIHIFAWDGETYTLLTALEGEAGIRLENTDGDLADEVVVGYEAGNDLAWEAIYTWDGTNYGWTWERYTWFYMDRPHAYAADTPEHAVISFYLAIDDRDLPGGYGLLSSESQAAQPYETWVDGFATTLAVEVGSVHEIDRSGDAATVAAQVRAYDNVDGQVIATLWDVEWVVVYADGTWRLGSVAAEQLDRWEAPYYP